MNILKQRLVATDAIHPADDIQLQDMVNRGEQDTNLRWVHHLYFADEATATAVCEKVLAAGWTQDWLSAQPEPFPGWMLRASRDTVVTRDQVRAARTFFEAIAKQNGGTYGGWDVRRVPKHALV